MRVFAGALTILVAAVASAAPVQTAPHDPLLWSDGAKPTAQANSLLRELRQCAERGLDPEDYPLDRLANQLAALTSATQSAAAPARQRSTMRCIAVTRGGIALTLGPEK